MNGGLNVEPLALRPPPWWFAGDASDYPLDCGCSPKLRKGTKRYVYPNSMLKLYGNDAQTVIIEDPFSVAPFEGDDQITPDDVQLRTFIVNGAVYLKILRGRDGQAFSPTFIIYNGTKNITVYTDLEIRK